MRLKTITAHELTEALCAIGAPPGVALRDPIHAMRFVASAPEEAILGSLRAILVPGSVPDLRGDELRLFGAAALARALVLTRKRRAVGRAEDVPDMQAAA